MTGLELLHLAWGAPNPPEFLISELARVSGPCTSETSILRPRYVGFQLYTWCLLNGVSGHWYRPVPNSTGLVRAVPELLPSLDIELTMPSVPPNVKFEIDDLEDEWTYSLPFDYIHSRVMTSSIGDWSVYLRKCYE